QVPGVRAPVRTHTHTPRGGGIRSVVTFFPAGSVNTDWSRWQRSEPKRPVVRAAQCAARVREAPIVERSEQEPAEAQRTTATTTNGSSALRRAASGHA